jgi:uncharacterized BrkB/YihY/UPF0761 family membrane protein
MSEAHSSPPQEFSRAQLFSIAVMCGLFLALVVHIALSSANVGLTSTWRDLFPTSANQLRSALAWWAIGASACAGSWSAVLLLRQNPNRQPLRRFLRVSLGAAFFCVLAAAGHGVFSTPAIGAAATAASNLAAITLGAFMAFCATHFALKPDPKRNPPRA